MHQPSVTDALHQWTQVEGPAQWTVYQCERCGSRLAIEAGRQTTPADVPNIPACPGRIPAWKRYSKAVERWIAAGRPVRSDQRVTMLYHTVCRPCEHFSPEKGKCRLCGCRIRESGPALFNKLKMATERCPASPAKWTEEIPA